MTTMVSNKIKIYVSSVLSRQVVAEPNRCLCGPRCVTRAPSRAPTNPPQVGRTRPCQVRILIALVAL